MFPILRWAGSCSTAIHMGKCSGRASYMFNQSTLVLEGVTLAQVVQLVVEVLVDLAGGTILDEKAAENSETAHPEDLAVGTDHVSYSRNMKATLILIRAAIRPPSTQPNIQLRVRRRHQEIYYIPRHSGILGTLPLTETPVSADPPGLSEFAGTSTRVHCLGLVDDEAIAQQLADGLAGVGGGDFVDFIRIQPDLALAAADHGRGQALLCAKVDPDSKRARGKSQSPEFDYILGVIVKRY